MTGLRSKTKIPRRRATADVSANAMRTGSSCPDRYSLWSNSDQSSGPNCQRRRANRMSRIYCPPRHLLNTPHVSHRRLGCPLCKIINGQLLVLGFLRIQFKLLLPYIRPLLVEVIEVIDKKWLGNTGFEMRDVHDPGRGVCGQEDQRVLVRSV